MKILLIMDPGISIPPPLYGGHERLVFMFSEQYSAMGHEVTLLAGPESEISGKAISFGKNDLKRSNFQRYREIFTVWYFLLKNRKKFDLIHNFGRLIYLLPILNRKVTKIMSYGREVTSNNIRLINHLPTKCLKFTAPSFYCLNKVKQYGDWTRVFNAIDFSKYTLTKDLDSEAPLIFLSRLDRLKGCHIAIEIAKKTNNKLLIAGNITQIAHEIDYFNREIKPFIDGVQIIYLGAVNDEQKNLYLGQCKAMLFPIETKEAFGMVMVESMACGTPVIAFNRGAVPEVIENYKTGIVVENKIQMIEAVKNISKIDRSLCRERSKSCFDVDVVSKAYLKLSENK